MNIELGDPRVAVIPLRLAHDPSPFPPDPSRERPLKYPDYIINLFFIALFGLGKKGKRR